MELPDPGDVAAYELKMRRVMVGEPEALRSRIELRDHDPAWAALYELEAGRARAVLGECVVRIEHVGSTSVPGLIAKPIIDIALEVPDSGDEAAYVPDMEAAGYRLRVREPEWFQHRLFKGPDTDVNLHTFSAGCTEVDRMVLFRDRLRADSADRELYASVKRDLAAREWKYMQQYADSKTAVVKEITARAQAGSAR